MRRGESTQLGVADCDAGNSLRALIFSSGKFRVEVWLHLLFCSVSLPAPFGLAMAAFYAGLSSVSGQQSIAVNSFQNGGMIFGEQIASCCDVIQLILQCGAGGVGAC
ncbi:MAG TPA: hypothetical protein DEF45_27140 [Rhodopirellula sp.]|nr:hypothetical protein [Rhodopirellula sp.]